MILAVDWGPVAAWAGTAATVAIAIVTATVALGYLSPTRRPRLQVTFEPAEPWVRRNDIDGSILWVRVGVENMGPPRTGPARGCVGRVVRVRTDGRVRYDVDTVQLRWASMPSTRAFEPMDVRNGQREFLDVLTFGGGTSWRIVTFDEPGYHPGFVLELEHSARHVVDVAVFADNATTVTTSLVLDVSDNGDAIVARQP